MNPKFQLYNADFKKYLAKYKVWSIIFSVVVIALGVLMCVLPLASAVVIVWIFIAFAGIASLAIIGKFIVGKNGRNAAELILGIIILLLVVGIIILGACNQSIDIGGQVYTGFQAMSIAMTVFCGIFVGIFSFVAGIYGLCCIGSVIKERKAFVIVNSIFNIIIGALMFIFPILGIGVRMIIVGIYLIIGGIVAIVLVCTAISHAKKAAKAIDKAVNGEVENKENVEDADVKDVK